MSDADRAPPGVDRRVPTGSGPPSDRAWRWGDGGRAQPCWIALLAEASAKAGQPEAGLILLAEALAVTNDRGERRWEAELYRLQGELLLRQTVPDAPQAEACFQQALTVARHQQAKSWELRAALSLSRLWQQQSKQAKAHELRAAIYGWFTEGFDTPDLQEAKGLLEELGGEVVYANRAAHSA